MHASALKAVQAFFSHYPLPAGARILDLAGLEPDSPLRKLAPSGSHYVSADRDHGPGVEVVIENSSSYPFYEQDFHAVLSVNRLEHDAHFWLGFLEVLRVLKNGGLFFLCTATNGFYRRSPADNWRLYPDAPKALEAWGRRQGMEVTLVESFVLPQENGEPWNDLIAVFQVGAAEPPRAPVLHQALVGATNVWLRGDAFPHKEARLTEDMQQLREKAHLQRRQGVAGMSAAPQQAVALSEAGNGRCNICGSSDFGPGPSGRLAVTGKAPHCRQCDSLERHRCIHHLLQKLPVGYLDWRRALTIGPNKGVQPQWFRACTETPFASGRSESIATTRLPDGAFDFLCFNHMLEFLPDAVQTFDEMLRLLSANGIMMGAFAGPMQRDGTIEYSRPAGQHGLRRLFGTDLATYLGCRQKGISVLAVEESDPCTDTREVIHCFVRSKEAVRFLQAWLAGWTSVRILQVDE